MRHLGVLNSLCHLTLVIGTVLCSPLIRVECLVSQKGQKKSHIVYMAEPRASLYQIGQKGQNSTDGQKSIIPRFRL